MTERWIGRSVPRVEDGRLLTGRGTFIDDHPPVANLCHAAIVRSPHAHARILGYDLTAALAMEGVVGAITGADVAKACKPFGVGVTAPVHYYPTAIDKVRFVGEPVAVVVARDRYLAEDAAEMVGGRLRAVAGGGRPGARAGAGRADPPREGRHEPRGQPPARLRRSRWGVRRRRRGGARALPVPQVRLHAHRDLRRDRALGSARRRADASGRTSWGRSSCTRWSRGCWGCPRIACASSCRPTSAARSGSSPASIPTWP